jgi:hypothetical protein
VAARGREGQRIDLLAQGKVIEDDAAGDVGENGAAIFVDGEEQVSARVEGEAGDVLSVRKGQRV